MARAADTAAEEPVAGNGWRVRAQQWLRARAAAASARVKHALLAAATAAIDTGIAVLQRLKKRAGGAEHPDEGRARELPGKRVTSERPRGEPAAEEIIAPKPRRRLRGLLIHLSVMLAGAMGGTALAYNLLAQLLDQRAAEIARQEVKLSKYSKSAAELKQRVDRQRAQQTETETRLTAALAENEKQLAGRASNPQPQADTGSDRGAARGSQAGWTRAGDCTLGGGDIASALKGCIAEMNRK